MPIVLYQIPASQPCRAVIMTAEHLGIELVHKYLDLYKGEHMKPEFLAINPQHTVPTIDDNGFILYESRAILTYLVNQYAPGSPLYPKEPKVRAIVDKVLNYDLGNLFRSFTDLIRPMIRQGLPADPEKEENFKKSLAILEKMLEKTTYVAANHLTVADYSILGNLSFAEVVIDFSFAEFPKISEWLQRMKKEAPRYEEINEIPLRKFREFRESKEFKEYTKTDTKK